MSSRRVPHHAPSNREQEQGFQMRAAQLFLVLGLIGVGTGVWWFRDELFPLASPPICPGCHPTTILRDSLEKLSPLWEVSPTSLLDLQSELEILEAAAQLPLSTAPAISEKESQCLEALISHFDGRLDQFVRHEIQALAGFGTAEACPTLHALLSLADRFQALLNRSTKEVPKCKNLLEWHSQQYSCSDPHP